MIKFQILTRMAALAAAATLTATAAIADDFPERPIQTIFPWNPGTAMAADQIIADAFGEEIGVPITLVSTPGAGGTKAFLTAMQKPADGYTLISGWVAPLVSAPASGNADWTYKDFIPLSSGVAGGIAIATRVGDDRFGSFMEMMEWGKNNPGKLRYSSGTAGNLPHKVMAKTLKTLGVVAQIVPYQNDAEARKDMQAGVIDFVFVNPGAYTADKEGFDVGLVLTDIPSIKALFDGAPNLTDEGIDIGLSGLSSVGWNWWVVHKDTPQERVDQLQEAMARAMSRKDVVDKLGAIGWTKLEWDHNDYDEIVGTVAEQIALVGDGLTWEAEQLKMLKE